MEPFFVLFAEVDDVMTEDDAMTEEKLLTGLARVYRSWKRCRTELDPEYDPRQDRRGVAFIYALVDPTTHQVRYVGKSLDPWDRLRQHMNYSATNSKLHRSKWLRKLQEEGLHPLVMVLDCCVEADWPERERFWIDYYRSIGAPLTNATHGGDGSELDAQHTAAQKAKQSASMKSWWAVPENRERMRRVHSGQPLGLLHRQRIAESVRRARRAQDD